jgi:hypothetical protein
LSGVSLIVRPSAAGVLSVLLLVVMWTTLSVAHAEKLLSTSKLAASPLRVGNSDFWLLVTSGLLVQRPIALLLVSFVVPALAPTGS